MPNTPKLPEDVEKRFERFESEFIEKREETRNKFGGVNIYRKLKIEKDISDVFNWYENEIATLKAQVRKEIEELKSGQKIDYGHDCYEKWCDYCDANKRDEAITDCLSISSLKEASNE